MSHSPQSLPSQEVETQTSELTRSVFVRYFNLYRIVLASAFAIFAGMFKLAGVSGQTFSVLAVLYWFFAVLVATIPLKESAPSNPFLALQVTVDIWILVAMMSLSGGALSGIPYLLMTTVAGAGLLGRGRIVLGFAAMATIAVLGERIFKHTFDQADINEISQAGMTSVGYFAVALISQLLASRALANEELARVRGADLERQRMVNANIIEDMLDGIVVLDRNGVIRQSNPSAVQLLGTPLPVGSALSESSQTLAQQLQSDESDSYYSETFRSIDSGRNLRMRRVLAGNEGDMVLYLEDLDRMQAQAKQITLAALGRLTANIAHEIRNPLSAVVHAADLLKEEKREQMQARLLCIVGDNAARIERIIKDVLELGRRDRATIERLDATHFLRHFLDEFAIHTPEVQTQVRLDIEESPALYFDRMHLHQILSNLLGNAMRYCKKQSGSVSIVCKKASSERVLIQVYDDGLGIPPEDLDKIFEPFFTSHPKGTGLGLYVARELAQANGGSLVLMPAQAERGADFHLYCKEAV